MAALRPLRVLLFAPNGGTAGHVVRVIAVARAMRELALERKAPLRLLLATTSHADALLEWAEIPALRLPSPGRARDAGWDERERLALLASLLRGAVDGFAPDILVSDTFAAGPHFELGPVLDCVRHRVLLRRTLHPATVDDATLQTGLERYDRVILADDPLPQPQPESADRLVRVAPITLLERSECLSRRAARDALGLDRATVALVTAGGGGDRGCSQRMHRIRGWLEAAGVATCFVAGGQLVGRREQGAGAVGPVPLQRYLAAFDLAVAAAGYNTAHELAKQGVPTVLWSEERVFDDQSARAERFERAGLAVALRTVGRAELLDAAARAGALAPRRVEELGARQAATRVLEVAA